MFSWDCPGSLDVVHTPLRRADIPYELIHGLQERVVTYPGPIPATAAMRARAWTEGPGRVRC